MAIGKPKKSGNALLAGISNGATFLGQDDNNVSLFKADGLSQIPDIPSLAEGNRSMARITYTDTTLNVSGSDLETLLRDYNRKLLEKGFGKYRRDLKKMDIIDTRNLIIPPETPWETPQNGLTTEEQLYCINNYWYAMIPCFEEGVLHVNRSRYIYWKIMEIAMGDNRMDVFLQDHIWYDSSGWQPGVAGVITSSFEDPDIRYQAALTGTPLRAKYAVVDNRDDYPVPAKDYGDIYRILDYKKDLGWKDDTIGLWDSTVVKYAKKTASMFWEKKQMTQLEALANLFNGYILKVNKALSDNTVQKSVPAKDQPEQKPPDAAIVEPDNSKTQAKSAPKPGKPKTRRVRTIGGLEVTSVSVPKAANKHRISNYTVTSWKRRGHIRTYKSGKKAYIRESVAHRKALQAPEEILPTTINFRKPKTEKQPDGKKGT